ncbi:autoinducer binding domain-containing protein [Labrenzia sp. R4_2]|uniref:helix-turn-helix transcriptional regulator n=1 Tax=Labrenzia sp. R4_2 TaxID=2821107 RepID=UPI001ADD50C1|nr:autoinducer binding domain-containing protein [Labrenzia sp. R4_2]MBO9422373.1 autoinducer binding domain-containing protein [Labrenzia sp. R4_2]
MELETSIELIQKAVSKEEAFIIFSKYIEIFGYDKCCYTFMTEHPSINKEAFHGFATSYPEDWINFYTENKYQKYDPVWLRLLDRPIPFFWRDALEARMQNRELSSHQQAMSEQVMNEGMEAGVADGIGVSFVSKSGEIAGIGISKVKTDKKKNYEELALISFLSATLHEKIIGEYSSVELVSFTAREKEVLSWASEGNTDNYIAEKIGITYATVRFHWNNILRKTQVNSKQLALMKAIRLGVILPQKVGYR